MTNTPEPDDEVSSGDESKKSLKRWVNEVKYYESRAKAWEGKSKKIIRRYKDVRTPREAMPARYNILWANTQLLCPAIYGKKPKPDIDRRFRDSDDVGRVTSMVLERSIDFFMNEEFDSAMKQAVLDLQLPGRGTAWVRYEPHFKDSTEDENEETADDGLEITDDVESYDKDDDSEDDEALQEVADEKVCFDYVHFEDFGHSFGRTWNEVDAGWRKVYLTREELIKRFGKDKGERVPLDYSPTDVKDAKIDEVIKKATIYECWCKSERKVYWFHKDFEDGLLDEQDDPLQLEEFWPFPKPLFATLANDDCIPVPDYAEYQDQAIELDELTSRIASITKSVKVAGIYDASAEGVQRLLAEGVENQLIPVDQMAVLGEKGGLSGVMMLMPMQDIMATLTGLYEARDKVKQDLYEITGISDIVRGSSDPNETYGAQRIKSQFGTLRLSARQDDVQRFARDLVKIGTEIIAKHFSLDTLKRISGIQLFTTEEKQLVTAHQTPPQPMSGPDGQPLPPLPPPPLPPTIQKLDPEELAERMQDPAWEEVGELLKNDTMLSYKIDIETDSTLKIDQETDKQSRMEFLTAMGSFLKEAMQAGPEMAPFMAKSLMFMMKGFSIGKELESAAELMIKQLEKKASKPPTPTPEMQKVQSDMQLQQQKMQNDKDLKIMQMQIDQKKASDDAQSETQRLQVQAQVDTNQAQLDAQLASQKAQQDDAREMSIAKMNNETRIAVAQIQAQAQLQNTQLGKEDSPYDAQGNKVQTSKDLMQVVTQRLEDAFNGIQQLGQAHQQLAQAIMRPKKVVRDENGNIVGVQ